MEPIEFYETKIIDEARKLCPLARRNFIKCKITDDSLTAFLDNGEVLYYDSITKYFRWFENEESYISEMRDDCEEKWRNKFSKNLERLLIKNGISKNELASLIGVSNASVTYYLYNGVVPNAYVLYKISKALNCSADDLLFFNFA